MKAKILLDGGKPKVARGELEKVLERAGFECSDEEGDFGVVVGGDGRFSRYGRTEDIPLLFVGVRSKGAAGSKAYLAATTFDRLRKDLPRVKAGEYKVQNHRRLGVEVNGRSVGEVFTDVYLQRGSESTCIRYNVSVRGKGVDYADSAVGDGVVVATRAGATGYFSYPDRVKGDVMDPEAVAEIGEGEVGICHIAPTYTERRASGEHPLRYRVPWGCRVGLSLFRDADARLYGIIDDRSGIRVKLGDRVVVSPGRKVTKVISLDLGVGRRK